MPVAIVEPLAPTQHPEPSQAVQVVREAIDAALDDPALPIRFQSLGPSPFHAEFSLAAASEADITDFFGFDVNITSTRAYDFYDFLYNTSEFPDTDAAFETLLDFLGQELDMYYRIVGVRAQKSFAWQELDALTWTVVRLHQKRGLRGHLDRLIHSKQALNAAFIALAEFEGTALLTDSSVERDYRDTYESDEPAYLKALVDQELKNKSTYPTEQSSSLIRLFETRRLSGLELTALFLSAVVGGLIGASASPSTTTTTNTRSALPPAVVECRADLRSSPICSVTMPFGP
jgi:antitoxin component HigA of HigAB toxin-antitoxin module